MERKVEGIIKEQYVVQLNNKSHYRGGYYDEDEWYLKGYGNTELEAIQMAITSTYSEHSILDLTLDYVDRTIEDILFVEDKTFTMKVKKYLQSIYNISDIEKLMRENPLYKKLKEEEEERLRKYDEDVKKRKEEERFQQYMLLKKEFDEKGVKYE